MQPVENASGKLTSDLGDLLTLDDDVQPATASQPATATPNYLADLLGDGLSAPQAPSDQLAAPAPDLLDLLGGSSQPPAGAPPTQVGPLETLLETTKGVGSISSRPCNGVFGSAGGSQRDGSECERA